MKLTSISLHGEPAYGIVENGQVNIPDDSFRSRFVDLKAVLAGHAVAELAVTPVAKKIPLGDVEFAPVIPFPGRILCVGINFRAHMKEMGREPPMWLKPGDNIEVGIDGIGVLKNTVVDSVIPIPW
jgi:2-keto-4-pentenoate hydratase/2-oxohepta-3-ene-1,7-dioic acid hydratase in catechol pathway